MHTGYRKMYNFFSSTAQKNRILYDLCIKTKISSSLEMKLKANSMTRIKKVETPSSLGTNKGKSGEDIESRRCLKKLYDKIGYHEKPLIYPIVYVVSQKCTTKYFFVEHAFTHSVRGERYYYILRYRFFAFIVKIKKVSILLRFLYSLSI